METTHKEPKSMQGIAIISSVSTPNEPSNAGPVGEKSRFALAFEGAYNFGQPRQ